MENILQENFLSELFRLCLEKKEIIEICEKVLKYEYLPSSGYKEIWKQIKDEYDFTSYIPTLGVLYENCKGNKEAINVLEEVEKCKEPNENQIILSLEEFCKNSMCIEFYDKFQELYSNNNRDEAIKYLHEVSDKLSNFSLSSDYIFSSVFKDFRDRQYQKKIDKAFEDEDFGFLHPVTGIDELDAYYPIEDGSVNVCLAQSGVGKTTFLIQVAVENARRGGGVLYVAGEGTKKLLLDKFDACWTAIDKVKLKNCDLTDEEISKLSKLSENITSKGGEIEFYLFEDFKIPTILDVYNLIDIYQKKHNGKVPDVLILDYLELFTVSGQHFAIGEEKQRRQAVATQFSRLITSKHIKAGFSATQTSDVRAELINSEEFVLTRNDISADKNLLNTFSFFFSLNQTSAELKDNVMRIYVDKSRNDAKKKQIFYIATAYDKGCFYDRKRTLQEFATSLV